MQARIAEVVAWIRSHVDALELDEDPVAVRVRLAPAPSPSPDPSELRVEWDGHRTADALADAAASALGGTVLPDPVLVRVEPLDGAGHAYRAPGSRSRTFRTTPERPPMPQPPPDHADAQGRPGVVDADSYTRDELATREELELLRNLTGGHLPGGAELPGDGVPELGRVGMGLLGLSVLTMRQAHATLLEDVRMQRHTIHQLSQVVVKAGSARDGLLEEVLPVAITAIGEAAGARADAEIAQMGREMDSRLSEAGGDAPGRQAVEILGELRRTMAMRAVSRDRPAPAAAQPSQAEPAAAQPSQAEPADTPAPAASAPADVPPDSPAPPWAAHLQRVLDGELAADAAAAVLVDVLEGPQRDQLVALARGILSEAGGESP